jgi:hypothetical protein
MTVPQRDVRDAVPEEPRSKHAANAPIGRVHTVRPRMTKSSTILFLAANPSDTTRLRVDEEARDIEAKVRSAEYRSSFSFKTRWALRADDLQQALMEERPVIVHFSGHGAGHEGIMVHGDNGEMHLISNEALHDLFVVLRDDIRIVLLNSCHSLEQAKILTETVDVVIGMSNTINDETARIFSAAFYRALASGRSVSNAFDLGVNAIKLQGMTDDNIPVIRTRSDIDANAIILVSRDRAMLSRDDLALPVTMDSAFSQEKMGARGRIIAEGKLRIAVVLVALLCCLSAAAAWMISMALSSDSEVIGTSQLFSCRQSLLRLNEAALDPDRGIDNLKANIRGHFARCDEPLRQVIDGSNAAQHASPLPSLAPAP